MRSVMMRLDNSCELWAEMAWLLSLGILHEVLSKVGTI